MEIQLTLFDLGADSAPEDKSAAAFARSKAKKLLRQLYKLRAVNRENPFSPEIQKLIDRVRSFGSASDTQIEETLLYCIEVQMAYELTEIVEDSGLDRQTVKKILNELIEGGAVRRVPKFIPGSDRQYFIYKSNRRSPGEMGDL